MIKIRVQEVTTSNDPTRVFVAVESDYFTNRPPIVKVKAYRDARTRDLWILDPVEASDATGDIITAVLCHPFFLAAAIPKASILSLVTTCAQAIMEYTAVEWFKTLDLAVIPERFMYLACNRGGEVRVFVERPMFYADEGRWYSHSDSFKLASELRFRTHELQPEDTLVEKVNGIWQPA
jgi:hypothetical protein